MRTSWNLTKNVPDISDWMTSIQDILKLVGNQVQRLGIWWSMVVGYWALLVYLGVQFLLPRLVNPDIYQYLTQPLLWSSLGIVGWLGWRYGLPRRPRLRSKIAWTGLLTGGFQVSALVLAGLMQGFGRSPYSHRPMALLGNLLYLVTILGGMELTRAYLMARFGRRKPLVVLVVVGLFFSFLNTSTGFYSKFGDIRSAIQAVGEQMLPNITENILACFLVVTGGPLASIAYRGVLLAFEWLSPVLPDPVWFIKAMLGTLVPACGLLVVYNQIHPATEAVEGSSETQPSTTAWGFVAVVAILLLGFNTGLFGVQPTLIASNSMSPHFFAGDVVVTQDVSAERIQEGDIIRFRLGKRSIVHRVVEISQDGGQYIFITRGDANDANDEPVFEPALQGKVILVIPKIGWLSIGLRQIFTAIL
jgi:signal peptidase